MQQPPLLPEETLVRVVRIARFDGLGALVLGGLFAISAAAARDVPFAAAGLLAAGAGAVELHGVALLRQGDARGMNWLIGSQPFLFLVILGYCGLKLMYLELPVLPDNMRTMLEESAQRLGMTVQEYLAFANRLTAALVAVVAFFYQGGMTLYYARRKRTIAAALTSEDS